ncbi:MAG: C39 family peptidase [Coriobacteriia bacterium]|nr:C39 family peptidase [Coriobacteriia bacterium]
MVERRRVEPQARDRARSRAAARPRTAQPRTAPSDRGGQPYARRPDRARAGQQPRTRARGAQPGAAPRTRTPARSPQAARPDRVRAGQQPRTRTSARTPQADRTRSRSTARPERRAPRDRSAYSERPRSSQARRTRAPQPAPSGGAAFVQVALTVLGVVCTALAQAGSFLWRAFRSLPGKAQPVVALVLLVVLLLLGRSFTGMFAPAPAADPAADQASQEQPQEQEDPAAQAEPQPQTDYELIDQALLSDYLSEDEQTEFMKAAQTNDDIAWIGAHIRDYDTFGYEIQAKLLKLAVAEPMAVDFVRHYPERAGSTDAQPCDPVEEGTVPALHQWDTRWAYADYSRSVIGLAGCGPTAMCMVYQGLTGQSDKSPYDFAMDAIVNDYVHSGTDQGFYPFEAQSNGLTYEEIGVSSAELKDALSSGHVVICNVGPGDFTQVGHFIVLAGLDDQGKLIVNDPYSQVRSEKRWDVDQVIGQTQLLMSFGRE